MAAYHSATVRASPLFPLFFQEFGHPFVSDVFQVLNHTHVVLRAVTFVEDLEPAAGEALTFVTKPHKSFAEQVATLFHEGAVFAAPQTPGAVTLPEPFLVQVALHRQVADAHAAIHTARRYQVCVHVCISLYKIGQFCSDRRNGNKEFDRGNSPGYNVRHV
jgi:hypothetical protein